KYRQSQDLQLIALPAAHPHCKMNKNIQCH
ncbi:uncharacterized protein METZ01_LOCUS183921, partial [marine metagenome]